MRTKDKAKTEEGSNSFDDLLRTHRKGCATALASKYLDQVTAAVIERGGTGEITLSVKVKSAGDNELRVEIQVKPPKLPTEKLPEGMYFFDDEAETPRLLKSDPRQGQLDLREVEKPAAKELREVGTAKVAND